MRFVTFVIKFKHIISHELSFVKYKNNEKSTKILAV
jgi:hypothetical protein